MNQIVITPQVVDQEMLRLLNEWAVLGFYEGLHLPWPRAYGLAYRRMYEQMDIYIPAERLLHPFEPFPHSKTRLEHNAWFPQSGILHPHHDRGLMVNREIAAEKQAQYPQYREAIELLVADLESRLPHFGGYTHSNPDTRRVVSEGYLVMDAELQRELAAMRVEGIAEEDESLQLMLALQDYSEGVKVYHRRVAEALQVACASASDEQRPSLDCIAESFAHGFLHPARTFLEGLLAVHFTWMLDFCDSIGRIDQALGLLFERDLTGGTLDINFARTLLDELFHNFERYNGWNMQIGGYTPDGYDGANMLTREIILACERNKLRRPNVAFRVTRQTPEDVLLQAIKALSQGSGRPALYNDDRYVDTLLGMDMGLSPEDAREIGFGGCTETMIAGMSNVGSLDSTINLAQALTRALYDGFDTEQGAYLGPHTGAFIDFAAYSDFLAAVKRQIQFLTDQCAAHQQAWQRDRFHRGDPKLYRSMFTRDCVKNRKSFEAGGARYNWATISYQGAANLIDSLTAVKRCIFEEQSVGRAELIAALQADFQGYEEVRQRLLSAPKFGNDDPYVDELGREIIGFTWDELYAHSCPRGGRFVPSCILFVTYEWAGHDVGATPDGRKSREPLVDSIGPIAGRDRHGPTAMLNSVAKLPLSRAIGTPILNIRFQKAIVGSDEGRRAVASLIRTFFARGGMQIQLSVISTEDMRAAQQRPDDYRDLIVRIGGYSEYFVQLTPALQESVIARTEFECG